MPRIGESRRKQHQSLQPLWTTKTVWGFAPRGLLPQSRQRSEEDSSIGTHHIIRVLDEAPFVEGVEYLNQVLRITENIITSGLPSHSDWVRDSQGRQLWKESKLQRGPLRSLNTEQEERGTLKPHGQKTNWLELCSKTSGSESVGWH